jgi:hypothetical protein
MLGVGICGNGNLSPGANALNVRAVLTIVTAFRTTLIIVRAALRMKKVTGILYPAIGIQIDKKKKYRRIKLGK